MKPVWMIAALVGAIGAGQPWLAFGQQTTDLGKREYDANCAVCHGAGGKGDGPTSATIFPKPADHTDPAYMKALTDEHLYRVIDGGGAAVGKSALMPPWGGALNEQDIQDVLAYVRTLSGT